ncbi:non-ribosomal peptide synthetase module [Paenibacillus sp. J2TS4]|uniref:non-ribosomal peptide synthetase module n=1 Tax=Paenibacillus sp. J2TS4 TaxID=2807194 RepID=UPI001B07E95B|nr:non-ribosomal peptide synthetase module [Paenibacillus sp. J2TS4]GIP31340.1 hypothetical protein J2TS4_05500 [Paenibacillus sp. J2TS4]
MAHRLATEYVKTCLKLSEAEMTDFIRLFEEQKATLHVKVLDNGNQNVVLHDDASGEEVVLTFEREANEYVCSGSCKLSSPNLVNLMRRAVSRFKGDAIVNRIYSSFIMVYHYHKGNVVKIIEVKGTQKKLVYEYKDTLGQLERLFQNQEPEKEIAGLYVQINQLLDLRNSTPEPEIREHIDRKLSGLTHRLFVLEA